MTLFPVIMNGLWIGCYTVTLVCVCLCLLSALYSACSLYSFVKCCGTDTSWLNSLLKILHTSAEVQLCVRMSSGFWTACVGTMSQISLDPEEQITQEGVC